MDRRACCKLVKGFVACFFNKNYSRLLNFLPIVINHNQKKFKKAVEEIDFLSRRPDDLLHL